MSRRTSRPPGAHPARAEDVARGGERSSPRPGGGLRTRAAPRTGDTRGNRLDRRVEHDLDDCGLRTRDTRSRRDVHKFFSGHGWFAGVCTTFHPVSGYRVVYEDGDEEDMTLSELSPLLVPVAGASPSVRHTSGVAGPRPSDVAGPGAFGKVEKGSFRVLSVAREEDVVRPDGGAGGSDGTAAARRRDRSHLRAPRRGPKLDPRPGQRKVAAKHVAAIFVLLARRSAERAAGAAPTRSHGGLPASPRRRAAARAGAPGPSAARHDAEAVPGRAAMILDHIDVDADGRVGLTSLAAGSAATATDGSCDSFAQNAWTQRTAQTRWIGRLQKPASAQLMRSSIVRNDGGRRQPGMTTLASWEECPKSTAHAPATPFLRPLFELNIVVEWLRIVRLFRGRPGFRSFPWG